MADIRNASSNPLTLVQSFARGELAPATVDCDADVDGCFALCFGPGDCSVLAPMGLMRRLQLGAYVALWFLLSVGYSISNKRVNMLLPCPCSVATSTVGVGSLIVSAFWISGLRAAPRLSRSTLRALVPIGVCHATGHLAGTVAVAMGSVSFTQIVKAANPIYVCALSTLLLRQTVSLRVWLSLVPIVGGVALAAVKEVHFVWGALLGAIASDMAMALRNVLSKRSLTALTDLHDRRLSSADMFGLLTLVATAVSLPVALAVDGRAFPAAWRGAAAAAGGSGALLSHIGLTGLLFYAYNEVAMLALSSVHQVRWPTLLRGYPYPLNAAWAHPSAAGSPLGCCSCSPPARHLLATC